MLAGGVLEAHEVKGLWQDDARAKIKIAVDMWLFRLITIRAKGTNVESGCDVEDFNFTFYCQYRITG